jgi:Tfp pilus assembly protein PilN
MGRDGPDWTAECAWESETELTDSIARLAAELPRPCCRVTVVLERPLVQVRTIRDLPPVRGGVLPQMVAAQERRFFRRNGRPLVTDAVWVEQNGTRVARAVAVEQPVVEAIAEGARAAGLALTEVSVAEAAGALSLLPPGERSARARVVRHRLRWLAAATAAVWLVAVGLFVGRLAWERRQVETALAALEAPLAAVREARREIRAAEEAVAAMQAMEAGRGRALSTLGAIARALPDSVVATSLVWTADGSGALGGVGRRASEAMRALEQAGDVTQPRLDGHVVRENVAGRDWERFTISFGQREGS